jgi:hypothetical protein
MTQQTTVVQGVRGDSYTSLIAGANGRFAHPLPLRALNGPGPLTSSGSFFGEGGSGLLFRQACCLSGGGRGFLCLVLRDRLRIRRRAIRFVVSSSMAAAGSCTGSRSLSF